MPKKIAVKSGTLFDLKAEFYRKKGQAGSDGKSATAAVADGVTVLTNKPFASSKSSQQRKEESKDRRQKIDRLAVEIEEEEKRLRLSREKLEKKSRLYDKMSRGDLNANGDEDTPDGDDRVLVNFQAKDRRREESDSEDDDQQQPSVSYDEEFVDYTDSLGRTRRCQRRDLPQFMAADRRLADHQTREEEVNVNRTRPPPPRPPQPSTQYNNVPPPLASASTSAQPDSSRLPAAFAVDRDSHANDRGSRSPSPKHFAGGPPTVRSRRVADIHYQDVASDDKRELGAGYFSFAVDQATRSEQMAELEALRTQTKVQRAANASVKQRRAELMAARLAKVHQRRRMGDGLDIAAIAGLAGEQEEVDVDAIPLPGESIAKQQREAEARRQAKDEGAEDREWDKGKKAALLSDSAWLTERRQDREQEFAPPTSYFKK